MRQEHVPGLRCGLLRPVRMHARSSKAPDTTAAQRGSKAVQYIGKARYPGCRVREGSSPTLPAGALPLSEWLLEVLRQERQFDPSSLQAMMSSVSFRIRSSRDTATDLS